MTEAAARLRRISIRDFRNLASVDLDLPLEGLVLVGDNGQGKTNFLEAVYYLQLLRSARATRDTEVVRFETGGFHLSASVDGSRAAREIGVGYERATKRKRVRLDGRIVDRLSDALGALPSVMFSPADVMLVAGEPGVRRQYLDIALALTSRAYLVALQQYRGALLRRNTVLREAAKTGTNGRSIEAEAQAWEPALSTHGATLVMERRRWACEVATRFEALCGAIGESGRTTLQYVSTVPATDDVARSIAELLEAKRHGDIRGGTTHAGPHRDTLALAIDGRSLRSFGSAGQQRSAAIALRLLEAETYRDRMGVTPVLLLDDPFAELDTRRATRIAALLADVGLGQVFVAVPREVDVPRGYSAMPSASVRAGTIHMSGVA